MGVPSTRWCSDARTRRPCCNSAHVGDCKEAGKTTSSPPLRRTTIPINLAVMRRLELLVLGLSLGCGGSVAGSQPPDGGLDAEPADVDSNEPWSTVCPESAPPLGTSCTIGAMVSCEYGSSWWDVSCDSAFSCSNGAWIEDHPSSEACFPAPGPNSASCPTSPSTITNGSACSAAGLACHYGTGAFCDCFANGTDADAAPSWSCGPSGGCPSSRPRLGATCSTGEMCYYGDPSGFFEQCVGGTWQAGTGGAAP